jgi:hypothetical protein
MVAPPLGQDVGGREFIADFREYQVVKWGTKLRGYEGRCLEILRRREEVKTGY